MNKTSNVTAKKLTALNAKPENDIDFSDIPATNADMWQGAKRGQFYRPIKQQLTIRVDSDILAWLKSQGKGYQSRMNDILRSAMQNNSR